jgi:hypothetical protein
LAGSLLVRLVFVNSATIAQGAKSVKTLPFGAMSIYAFIQEAKMQPQFTLLLNTLASWGTCLTSIKRKPPETQGAFKESIRGE